MRIQITRLIRNKAFERCRELDSKGVSRVTASLSSASAFDKLRLAQAKHIVAERELAVAERHCQECEEAVSLAQIAEEEALALRDEKRRAVQLILSNLPTKRRRTTGGAFESSSSHLNRSSQSKATGELNDNDNMGEETEDRYTSRGTRKLISGSRPRVRRGAE